MKNIMDIYPEYTRTFSDVMKDVDKAKTDEDLIAAWNEIVKNKYQYTLAEIRFTEEHIDTKCMSLLGVRYF